MKILHNLTTVSSASVTSEATGYLFANAYDITNFKVWRSTTNAQQNITLNFTGSVDAIQIVGANFASITIGGVAKTLVKDTLTGYYKGYFTVSATSSLAIVIPVQSADASYFSISGIAIGNETSISNVTYPVGVSLVNPVNKITLESDHEVKKAKGQNYRLIEIKREHLDLTGIEVLSAIKASVGLGDTFGLYFDDSDAGECYLGTRVDSFAYTEKSIEGGSDSLILEETGGVAYNLRNLIEITLDASTLYYGPEDMEFPVSAPVFYEGRIINSGTLRDQLADVGSQFTPTNTTTITLGNTDFTISDLDDTEDLRGKTVTIKTVDLDTDTVLKSVTFTVEEPSFSETTASLSLESIELDVWHMKHPLEKFTLTNFPDIPDGSQALDKGIPEYYGYNYQVPCYYVLYDTVNDYYDYVIGKTGTDAYDSCTAVYRDGKLVDSGEYTFYDGSQGSPYSGYSFLRFVLEQKNFSGQPYKITADIKGYEISASFEENPVVCFKHWLENRVGVTCNSTSFTAAEAVADTLNLKIGGGIIGDREAIDWRTDWLLACRCASLVKGASGYEITIPTYQDIADVDFTASNFDKIAKKKTKASSFINNVNVKYYYDIDGASYLKNNEKSCSKDFGTDKEYQLRLVNDDETASRISQYLRNKNLYGDVKYTLATGYDAIELVKGNIASITDPDFGLSDSRFEIADISKSKFKTTLELTSYSNDIFGYTAESYQGEPPTPTGEGDLATPADFTTTNIINGIKLSWTHNTEKYLKEYEIYRDGAYYKTTKTNIYNDLTEAYSTEYTYKIRAVSNQNNYSSFTGNETGTAQKAAEADLSLTYGTASLYSSITTNASNITLKVSSTDYEPNDVAAKINSSTVTLTPDSITMTSGNITMNTSGKVLINSENGLEISSSGDLLFTDCCKLDASSTDMRIYPTTTGKGLYLGAGGSLWSGIGIYANAIGMSSGTGAFSLVFGDGCSISGAGDITLECGDTAGYDVIISLPSSAGGASKPNYRIWRDASGYVRATV